MSVLPAFLKRDLVTPVEFKHVQMAVERFSWSVRGGPLKATIRAGGDEMDVYDLVNYLRAGVTLADGNGDACWWGCMGAVDLAAGGIQFGASLETMYNRVAVAYEDSGGGVSVVGMRETTAWAEDADSVAEFGAKELLDRLNSGTQVMAEIRRARLLAAHRYPAPQVKQGMGRVEASLACEGWYNTLGWRYYQQLAGGIEYAELGDGVQAFGNASGSEQLAQSFTSPGGTDTWKAATIVVKLRKEGLPTDTVYAELYSDTAGAPGTLMDSGSVDAADIPEGYEWVSFALDDGDAITAGTTYWLVLRRSGSNDGTNHYMADVNQQVGYSGGVLRLWNGAAWVARGTDADMLFRVAGTAETTQQIATLVTAIGQFFEGTDIEDVSGIYTTPYRDGDSLGLGVLTALLDSGTDAEKRLLSRVTAERRLKVTVEPDAPASYNDAEIFLLRDGRLVDRNDRALGAADIPVGQWCVLRDALPPTLDLSKLIDPTLFFIDEAEYDVAKGMWSVTRMRGAGSVFDAVESG